MKLNDLISYARRARQKAHAPYSRFLVGAALESVSGKVFGGCNIENCSYGLTVCAERVAAWKAVSAGETRFRRLVVVADTESLTPPCGACRQVLWDQCRDIDVVIATPRGVATRTRLATLLPLAFEF